MLNFAAFLKTRSFGAFLLALNLLVFFFVASVTVADSSVPIESQASGPSSDAGLMDLLASVESGNYDGSSDSSSNKADSSREKFEFQAEVSRMMNLIIHSLYKAKEIFIRELISNASDALDKIRFLSLTQPSALGSLPDLNITVQADADRQVIIIRDTGVGMTRDDMVKNLGTIAKSGTSEFLRAMESNNKDDKLSGNNLIGQFGVGFYSAYLVADKVSVISKNNDDADQWIWESDAGGDFTIARDPRGNTLGRGTAVVLHLKSEAKSYLDQDKLERIIRKYSEFINFPIYLMKQTTEQVDVELTEEEIKQEEERLKAERLEKRKEKQEKEASEDDSSSEDGGDSEDKQDEDSSEEDEEEIQVPKTKKQDQTRRGFHLMNTNKPIWTRDPKQVDKQEYLDFFKGFFKFNEEPLTHLHFKAEGDVDFRSLLFIPGVAPPMLLQDPEMHVKAIKLYVRRVFITDELLDFLPKYLGFLKGIVDSDDLPLNVSRETLQKNRLLRMIKRKIVQKALEMIRKLSEDKEKYRTFLKQYGTSIKVGTLEDEKNRKKLVKLLRFPSSHDETEKTSLEDYVARMKKGQPQIYFMTGSSLEEIKKSPFVERVLARGYEVIYADEPIDEYVFTHVRDYEKHPFQNVAKSGMKLGDEDEDSQSKQELKEKFKPLSKYLEDTLAKNNVDKVVVSNRLTNSPCAIVASEFGWTGNMERLMSSQTVGNNPMEQEMHKMQLGQKKTLEINPRHPVIKSLLSKVNDDDLDEDTEDLVGVLYDTAVLRSGYSVKDTVSFAARIEHILRSNLGIDPNEKVEEEVIEKAPEKDEDEVKKEQEEKAQKKDPFDDDEEDEEFEHDEL